MMRSVFPFLYWRWAAVSQVFVCLCVCAGLHCLPQWLHTGPADHRRRVAALWLLCSVQRHRVPEQLPLHQQRPEIFPSLQHRPVRGQGERTGIVPCSSERSSECVKQPRVSRRADWRPARTTWQKVAVRWKVTSASPPPFPLASGVRVWCPPSPFSSVTHSQVQTERYQSLARINL